jgi:hypothetical protein
MKAFRLALALAAILTATACSGDLTGPSAPTTGHADIVIGSPG